MSRLAPVSVAPARKPNKYLNRNQASFSAGSGIRLRIMSEAFSAIISTQALICAETRSGMTDASTTRRRSTPRTRSSGSVTVSGVVPMAQVPQG